ncbi:hypothetical protein [Streptomyces sp. NPDC058252]|uniref:hypothetical protein n=1 Tax=Streptomyces sp. NPDC058252 TaxID=3346405 RepID=UPI0036EE755C
MMRNRGLIDSAVPRRILGQNLPCLGKPRTIVVDGADPELPVLLARERDRMTLRIDCLTRNRDALDSNIDAASAATPERSATSTA